MMAKHLDNKSAIVTGGAQGLGQAISQRLAREGCQVLIADVNETGADATAAAIAKETGQRVLGMKVDVTQEADVRALFDRAAQEFGRVDIVVANAAILIAEPIAEANAEKWRAVMNVNLFGYFLVTKHACRVMKGQGGGAIININSKSGKKGSAANSAYAASKFGSVGHTQSVALEMAPFNIRCNAICPGNLLDSPLWTHPDNGLFVQYLRAGKVPGAESVEDVRRAYVSQVPMRRGCSYDDVCNAVVFLASDQSSYITGVSLSVTGGQEMN
ncbi:MAG TPA: SDR family oxidoreductase [Candidatus Paceibacterota bacterium]|nr:SDR family oxidoreductase [Verrucomicrobiota bacterium]HSA10702.1 SDR family oxidoreductase [Candidatus Paceibacterota bacterium]